MIALRLTRFTPHRLIAMAILLGYLITIHIGIPAYINTLSVNTVLGIMAIVFTWQGGVSRKFVFGWMVAACALLLLYGWFPSKFILYIAIGLGVL